MSEPKPHYFLVLLNQLFARANSEETATCSFFHGEFGQRVLIKGSCVVIETPVFGIFRQRPLEERLFISGPGHSIYRSY